MSYPTLIEQLAAIVGAGNVLTATADTAPYLTDWRGRYHGSALCVVRPASTAEVAALVRACAAAGVAIVAQGGNTSHCGASIPDASGTAVLLSLSRMKAIRAIDTANNTLTVDAGCVLHTLQQAALAAGRLFPLALAAQGSCQIGGNLATNVGGINTLRYGTARDNVLGLEVVLPDGRIWNGMRAVQKDNAGYQLKRLFCGAEGTLGVVTRAVLRLFPAPRQRATAFLALADEAAAVAFGTRLRAGMGEFLTALEFFSETGLALALKHVPALAYPLQTRSGCYLLIEVASGSARVPLDDILAETLEQGIGDGLVLDGALAASEAQRAAFWRLREEQPEGQRLEGPQLKHDIAVPPGRIADFVGQGQALCHGLLPGVRINPFGHLADGNIHYNLTPPEGAADFAGQAEALALALARLASDMGGSFAAEHGLGRSKIALADALRPEVERGVMRAIKAALDPGGVMNPGVVLRDN